MKKTFLLIVALLILYGAYWYRPKVSLVPVVESPNLVVEEKPEQKPPVEVIEEVALSIRPGTILQGDPAMVVVENLPATTTVKSLTFNGKSLGVFSYDANPSALIGIDLRQTTGSYPLVLTLSDGRVVKKNIKVGERIIAKAPLGIPETLGGNTSSSEQTLLSTLAEEGAIINAVKSGPTKLWNGNFSYPLKGEITITDVYGYSRITGASTIAHKGTDFRATVGTPVYAMNSGVVAYTDYLRNYGNTIIIDHGQGLLTIYMHLSKVDVAKSQKVEKGVLIGKSGETGYVLGPHLHLTVRINGISIDPEKFMALLGE